MILQGSLFNTNYLFIHLDTQGQKNIGHLKTIYALKLLQPGDHVTEIIWINLNFTVLIKLKVNKVRLKNGP